MAIIFLCYFLPCSVAIQVHPDGDHEGVGPPSPKPGSPWKKLPPPHHKTLQAVANAPPCVWHTTDAMTTSP
ncbi:hypothetical protein TRIUR3_02189 [Triticum urartu]|uniref:Uncharacterized protein n=1 Tax=Triticum urartu TaxID=4572 RepID=M7YED8_TRIUA|nr:hypothetical protein TRIUR3_02189 [Triticum urartu]